MDISLAGIAVRVDQQQLGAVRCSLPLGFHHRIVPVTSSILTEMVAPRFHAFFASAARLRPCSISQIAGWFTMTEKSWLRRIKSTLCPRESATGSTTPTRSIAQSGTRPYFSA